MEKKLKNIQTFEQHTDKNLNISDVSSSDTITLTKDELRTFMDDVSGFQTGWSDTSYRICRFLGIDPTDGI